MNRLTRRGMRLTILTVGFAGLFVAVNAVPGAATGGSGFTPTLLGHSRLSPGTLRATPGSEVVVTSNEVLKHGFSGWHSHPGGAIIVVVEGQITTYRVVKNEQKEDGGDASNSSKSSKSSQYICAVNDYKKGDLFFERAGEPLDAVNNGETTTVIIATFPGVPALGQQRTERPQPNPDPCPV